MKKILIAVALASMVATSAQAGGRGGHGHYGHYHGGGSYFWWGAAVGAALTIPFYYSRSWVDQRPYYYYNPGPTVYVNPPIYVQAQPLYVQSQPTYLAVAPQAGNVVPQTPSNGVTELGPVNALPPAHSNAGEASSDQWFVYPSRGQGQQQQANDRYACNRWATNESGYDPDLRSHRNPESGPVNYGRALSACLEGRGYTVR